MSALYLPPNPSVVFEDHVCTGTRRTTTDTTVSSGGTTLTYDGCAVAIATQQAKQVQIADGTLTPITSNVISMRAANPSLGKKIRTERMSRLEREYRW